jgi:hypothetical protein
MKEGLTNVAASVRARLLNKARAEERPFAELLQYYAMERFLYRLSESPHRDRFVLKGALMFSIWGGPATRATKDIDLLSSRTEGVNALVGAVSECLQTGVASDGLTFDPGSVTGEEIRIDAEYNGVRLRFRGTLGSARVSVQVDVGFGDVVTPGAELLTFPTLLDLPAPKLAMYTPETAIAEKVEAMVALGAANTRLKDSCTTTLAELMLLSSAAEGNEHASMLPRDGVVSDSAPGHSLVRYRQRKSSCSRGMREKTQWMIQAVNRIWHVYASINESFI